MTLSRRGGRRPQPPAGARRAGPWSALLGRPRDPWPPALLALAALVALPELVLLGADLQLWGSPAWRSLAYGNGAFWAGLLRGWQPNYAGQPILMFVTYGFLHAGPGHLAGNVLTLLPLGRMVAGWLGVVGFLAVYAAALGGGAAAFGLLSAAPVPMVGASGAIFGLAGALVARDWLERRRPATLLAAALALVALNLAAWVLLGGRLAWETHGGGALAGAAAAWLLGRKPR